MNSPFHEQVSEYDCVPTTFINALGYLFDRAEIPPLVVQRVYIYCLDTVASYKRVGHGTTGYAVQLLTNWLNDYRYKKFLVNSEYLSGKKVHLSQGNKITQCLNLEGVALIRVTHQKGQWHYILGLSVKNGWLYAFDPYPRTTRANRPGCYEFMTPSSPHAPNLKIACKWLDKQSNKNQYRLGTKDERECVLLSRI